MPGDDVEDDGGFGQPLPPDDRLWRHPSEIFATGAGDQPALAAPTGADRSWTTMVLAGVVGALLATALIATAGAPWGRDASRDVVERVALTPVVSAPTVRGDRKVIEVTEQVRPSVALITSADGSVTGSAVVFRDDGHLLTSAVLVRGTEPVFVTLGGTHREARAVGVDLYTGVAVLRVDGPPPPAAVLAEVATLRAGEPAVAIGAVQGGQSEPVVATGVVSALSRRVDRPDETPLYGMLQVDVPLASESVGGPVVDSRGAVIGIIDPSSDPTGSFGFAVPIDVARRVADDIIDTGAARHCWMGIEGSDLDPAEGRRVGLPPGPLVARVLEGSPAEDAGLVADDVITHFGGSPVATMDDLVTAMRSCRPGDEVVVRYVRVGQAARTRVTVGERPPHG
jgi:S1-C subfamily serine protease